VQEESRRAKSQFKDPGPPYRQEGSQAILDFLSTTDVARLVPAEDDTGSEASEWERRERREREEERRVEAEELGAREELPLFLPAPSFMASADEDKEAGHAFLCSFFCSGSFPL